MHTAKWGLCFTSQSTWSLRHPSYTCTPWLPSRVNQWLTVGRNLGKLTGPFHWDPLQRDTILTLHLLGPMLSQQALLTQTSICHTPGHKTHTLASSFENNTLRGIAQLFAKQHSFTRTRYFVIVPGYSHT